MKFFTKKTGQPKFKEAKAKWNLKDKLSNATVKATSFVLGDTHFIVQSIADGVARTEASILHPLTGEGKPESLKARVKATEMKQQFIKQQIDTMAEQFNRIIGVVEDDIINDVNPEA
jgi:hypothetical protein